MADAKLDSLSADIKRILKRLALIRSNDAVGDIEAGVKLAEICSMALDFCKFRSKRNFVRLALKANCSEIFLNL
jgi:hypothetical protein